MGLVVVWFAAAATPGVAAQELPILPFDDAHWQLWQASAGLRMPESVLWDPSREVTYVSSFDGFAFGLGEAGQHLTRLAADGRVLDEVWVGGLTHPTGLAWKGGHVLAVEPRAVAVIDPTHRVIAIDLDDREIHPFAMLPPGTLDGIEPFANGGALVSSTDGKLFRVSSDGAVTKLYDSSALDRPCADIEVVPDRGVVLIPTYFDGQVVALGVSAPG